VLKLCDITFLLCCQRFKGVLQLWLLRVKKILRSVFPGVVVFSRIPHDRQGLVRQRLHRVRAVSRRHSGLRSPGLLKSLKSARALAWAINYRLPQDARTGLVARERNRNVSSEGRLVVVRPLAQRCGIAIGSPLFTFPMSWGRRRRRSPECPASTKHILADSWP
jgi:hypothetical protein